MVKGIQIMDEKLILLKKNKPVRTRCVLTDQNDLILYEPNDKTVKVQMKLKDCEKMSRYQDNSWEITYKAGKSFRFLGDKSNSTKWFNTLYSIFSHEVQGRVEHNKNNELNNSGQENKENQNEVQLLSFKEINKNQISSMDENIYELVIDRELTDPDLLNMFSLKDTYILRIDESGIILENEEDKYNFEPSSIKKYGSTRDCFAFELGRNSPFGRGIIALQSKKYNSKVIYDHFNELTEQCFYRLHEKKMQEQTDLCRNSTKLNEIMTVKKQTSKPLLKSEASMANQDSDASLKWFTPNSSSIGSEKPNLHVNTHKSVNTSCHSMGSISSIPSFSTVEIPIIVEERSSRYQQPIDLNVSSISKTSTYNGDETLTFYEEKYIPEYMNTKNLVSKPLEFFEDSDHLVYARVKL